MKSSFLLTCILASLVSLSAWGQTNSKATAEVQKSSFDKFYERLKIGYFGAYAGSSLDHWENYGMDEHGVKDQTMAPNLWNQLSFNYNFGAKMNFVVNPRWTMYLQPTSQMTDAGTRGLFQIEDALVGFQGVWLSSEDKKFSLWSRPGVRLPTSRASREGDVTANLELTNVYTYDFNKQWQLGVSQQLRQWVYEQRYTAYRYRLYHQPYIQYAINDTNRVAVYYEHYFENRKRRQSQNGKDPIFKRQYENIMLGWSHDFNSKFNVMPFLAYLVDGKDISSYPARPAWFGAWISYTIK